MPTSWLLGCASGADPFIEKYFYDCVYNLRDYVGFCLGLAAILFWVVAQIPQWVRNFRTKSAEALSPWFLAQWLLGDTFNLLGCLLQGQQLPTTTYTAMYFVVADVFMMMQYIYYGALQRRKQLIMQLQVHRRHHRRRHHHHDSDRSHPSRTDHPQRIAGSDSSSKDRTVWQRQRQQQQQQQPLHTQQEPCSNSSKQNASQSEQPGCSLQNPLEQQQTCLISHAEQQQQVSNSWQVDIQEAAAAGYQPEGNAVVVPAAVGVGVGGSFARMPCSYSHRLAVGGIPLGSSRLVTAVAMIVMLGLVSLVLPAAPGKSNIDAKQAAAPTFGSSQRLIHAGESADAHSAIHARNSHSSRGSAYSSIAGQTNMLSSADAQQKQDRLKSSTERSIAFVVGTMLGYCSSVLYLCSRVSQIHKNYTRKSSEGLALAMFMMAVCANLCTGTGIVLRTFTWQELKEQLPWIIGSLGTIMLDMVILWQSVRYSSKAGSRETLPTGSFQAAVLVEDRQQLLPTQHANQHQPDQLQAGCTGEFLSSATAAARITIASADGSADAAASCGPAASMQGWASLHRRQTQSSSTDRAQGGDLSREDADAALPLLLAVD